jgi:membrane fusion protein, multidrug efflux system
MDLKSVASTRSPGAVKVALVGAFIALVAAGFLFYSRSQRNETAAPATQPVPVIATEVRQGDVPIILTGLGTVTAL